MSVKNFADDDQDQRASERGQSSCKHCPPTENALALTLTAPMGACASQPDRASKSRSDEIDRQLDEDSKRYKKECKILLLGSGESGKSTIVKQMKIIHQQGFSTDELRAFRPTIHKNAVDSAQAVVDALSECGLKDLLAEQHRHLPAAILAARPEDALTPETADAIEVLWRDPVIPRLLDEHGSEFYLMDSAQ